MPPSIDHHLHPQSEKLFVEYFGVPWNDVMTENCGPSVRYFYGGLRNLGEEPISYYLSSPQRVEKVPCRPLYFNHRAALSHQQSLTTSKNWSMVFKRRQNAVLLRIAISAEQEPQTNKAEPKSDSPV